MATELATGYVSLSVSSKGIKGDLERELGAPIEQAVGRAGSALDNAGGKLSKYGGLAAATAAAAGTALFKMAGGFQDLAIQSSKGAAATGLSVEQTSRLIEATGDLGIEFGTVQGSLGKMNKAADESPEKFSAIGAELVRNKDGALDVQATFLNVVDSLNAIEDPARRQTAAADILGRGWQSMSELIAGGSDALEESLLGVSDAKVIDPGEVELAKDMRSSMDALKDSGENLALELGKGAVPVISALATAASTVVGWFGDINAITDGTAGKILAIGTVAVGAVGGLSLLAGQAIKIRSRFLDAAGGMTNFGKAAAGAGVALGAFSAATIALEVIDQLQGRTGDTTKAFNSFLATLGNSSEGTRGVEDIFNSFTALSQEVQDTTSNVDLFGDVVTNGLDQPAIQLESMSKAFDDVLSQSPESAMQLVESLEAVAAAARNGNESAKENLEYWGLNGAVIASWRQDVMDATAAQHELTGATDDNADAAGDNAAVQKTLAERYADTTHRADALTAGLEASADAFEQVADDASAHLRNTISLEGGYDNLTETLYRNAGQMDLTTDAGRENANAILELGGNIRDDLNVALKDSAGNWDDARLKAATHREELRDTLRQFGLTETQIESYIEALGLTPSQVETAISLTGEELARQKIELLQIDLSELPKELQTDYVTAIDQGRYEDAVALVKELVRPQELPVTPVLKGHLAGIVGELLTVSGGFREHGGAVTAGQAYVVGERRAEVFVPKVDGYIEPSLEQYGASQIAQYSAELASLDLRHGDSAASRQRSSPLFGDVHVHNDTDADGFFRMANMHLAGV